MSSFALWPIRDIASLLLQAMLAPKAQQPAFDMTTFPSGSVVLYEPIGFEFYTLASSPWGLSQVRFCDEFALSKPQPVLVWLGARREAASLSELIDDCVNPANLEENEPPPLVKAITDIKRLIGDASAAIGRDIQVGDVAAYFGEISITWRKGNRMLRATSFSDARPPRLDFGTTPAGALGDYQFEPNATGAQLIEKLAWLFPEELGQPLRVQ